MDVPYRIVLPSLQQPHELYERFGFEPDLSNDVIQEKLKGMEEQLKKAILTEMKIKEGADNLRRATNDRKSLLHVGTIIKEANSKLEDLKQELTDVQMCLLMTSAGNGTSRRQGDLLFIRGSFFFLFSGFRNETCSWKVSVLIMQCN